MKTDYSKLNHFDVCALVLVLVGLVIVGFEIYFGLPASSKQELAAAVQVFDISEQAQRQVALAADIFDTTDRFYKETYLAFAETWSFPNFVGDWADRTDRALVALGSFSEQVAGNYSSANLAYHNQSIEGGLVLGASIEQAAIEPVVPEPIMVLTRKYIPYGYSAPRLEIPNPETILQKLK